MEEFFGCDYIVEGVFVVGELADELEDGGDICLVDCVSKLRASSRAIDGV